MTFGAGAGKLDLTVITNEPSVQLIEAKLVGSRDSKAKVLGQIVCYLAHARECKAKDTIRAVIGAAGHKVNTRPGFWNGSKRELHEPESRAELEGWIEEAIESGSRAPNVRAFIALDDWSPDSDNRRLRVPLEMLAKHNLPISIILKSGEVRFPEAHRAD